MFHIYFYISSTILISSLGFLTYLQNDWINLLKEKEVQLRHQITGLETHLDSSYQVIQANSSYRSELQSKLNKALKGEKDLQKKFAKHDLEALARQKPVLIERAANRNIERMLNDAKQLNLKQ